MNDPERIGRVVAWIAEARRVVVLTGAGISTESGIPDFRGPQGVWTRDPAAEKLATLQYYMADPAIRREAKPRLTGSQLAPASHVAWMA